MNNINSSIDKYRNIHKKSKIAILGSSPTLELYENKEDISIAVNGAPLCLSENYKINYFMCGDKDSHDRQWFLSSEKFNAISIVSFIIAGLGIKLYLKGRKKLVKVQQYLVLPLKWL